MKEVIFYLIAAVTSLVVLGYSVHMFVGGLVDAETERWLITGACLLGAAIIAVMGWDVVRRRRARG
jgi:Mn2+/Fe2+ NRAMP family transporter